VRDTVSTETQAEVERRYDVEVQTTLSVPPDSASTSPRSPAADAAIAGSQWPPYQQHQQMLQLLLLQRQQQQRAPATGRPPNAPPSPRSPAARPGDGRGAVKPRKGSAPEFATDFGRTLCVSAAANSAFRPVLTTRTGDWSPSRRSQHEPRLPYFEVRDVTGDSGKRFFRPIVDGTAPATTADQPPTSADEVFDDSVQLVTADSTACANQVSPAVRTSDINVAGPSRDADSVKSTTAERSPAASSRSVEVPPPPAAATTSRSHKVSSAQSRSAGTKLRRAYRSKTAELRLHRPSASVSTGSVSNSPAVRREVPACGQDQPWAADDEDEEALFGSEAGSIALSSASARSRAKSDSSVTHSARSVASESQTAGPSVGAASSSSLADARQQGGRRRSAGWALDSAPPDGTTDGTARSLRTSPFRQSASPLIIRKLKSAAELLRESNELHQHRHGSSSSRLPVPVIVPEMSYCITGTPPSSTSSAVPPPSTQDTNLDPDPQTVIATSTAGTESQLQTSETATSSTSEHKTCVTYTADSRPTEAHPQSSPTGSISQSRVCTKTTVSTTMISADTIQVMSQPTSQTTATAETARGSRTAFLDRNWFPVPKFFKTPK